MATTIRNYRTPIGILRVSRKGLRGRLVGALTLTIAAGRARGTHTDRPIDGRDLYETRKEHRAICDEWIDKLGLASIEVYAPARHNGHTVEVIEVDDDPADE